MEYESKRTGLYVDILDHGQKVLVMAQGTEDSTVCLFGFETNPKDKSAGRCGKISR